MAKRQFLTVAMIIATGAVTTAASANQTAQKWTGSVYRGTGQPAVSSIVRLDEDITALGGLQGRGKIVTVAAQQNAHALDGPIIVNPASSTPGSQDTLGKPPPVPGGQDSLTRPPPVQGIGQDTLRPPVVPRIRRTVPKTVAPGGPNKP